MTRAEVVETLSPIHRSFHEGGFSECEQCSILLEEFTDPSNTVVVAKPRRMGRPPLPMPEPIDATPEEIARKIMNTPPPKDGWQYMKNHKARKRRRK